MKFQLQTLEYGHQARARDLERRERMVRERQDAEAALHERGKDMQRVLQDCRSELLGRLPSFTAWVEACDDFGAVDFAEPRELLPTAASALRPDGRPAFSTLARHLGGAPAHPAAQHTETGARPRTQRRPARAAGCSGSRCEPNSSTRRASPGSAARRCPAGPDRAPPDAPLVTAFRTHRTLA
jgi:hypothetical protein